VENNQMTKRKKKEAKKKENPDLMGKCKTAQSSRFTLSHRSYYYDDSHGENRPNFLTQTGQITCYKNRSF
ncbi:MAG: hypothetical protein ACRD1R_10410, partial [Acidobacteriota bacterium]